MLLLTTIRTLITFLLLVPICLVFGLIALPLVLLPASYRYENHVYHWLSSLWTRLLLFVAGIKVRVAGAENLPAEPCVVAMNHASSIDILVIERVLGSYPRVWLSRMAYKRVPILSTIIAQMHVIIDLTSARTAARALAKMLGLVRGKNCHALIFPEGGRFTDGKIHDFYRGFVVLARKLNRSVLPVYISNAHHIFDPNGYLINTQYVLGVTVGKPMSIAADQTDEQFVAQVRDWFVAQATTARKQLSK